MSIEDNARKHIGFNYIFLDMHNANPSIVQRAIEERIDLEFKKTHWIAISATCPEVYYKLDLLCDNSGFCTCPSFIHKQANQGKPCKHLVALDRVTA